MRAPVAAFPPIGRRGARMVHAQALVLAHDLLLHRRYLGCSLRLSAHGGGRLRSTDPAAA